MLFCDTLSLESGEKMEYPKPQSNKNTLLARILATVNFILLVIITVSFNYLVIDFLF